MTNFSSSASTRNEPTIIVPTLMGGFLTDETSVAPTSLPPEGYVRIYVKNDGLQYYINHLGQETAMGGSTGGYMVMRGGTKATTNTSVYRFTTVEAEGGNDISRVDSVANGMYFEILTEGMYSMLLHTGISASFAAMIHRAAALSNTPAENSLIGITSGVSTGAAIQVPSLRRLFVGDRIFCRTTSALQGYGAENAYYHTFSIARL